MITVGELKGKLDLKVDDACLVVRKVGGIIVLETTKGNFVHCWMNRWLR